MFKHITVAFVTPVHTKESFNLGLGLAKKFGSELLVIECVYSGPPKFHFFEAKADREKFQKQKNKIKEELKKWEKIALQQGVKIKTKFALTDSVAKWVIDFVKENKVDLLIVDYPKLSAVEATHYDEIVNTIHHKADCHVLTTKR